MQSFIQEMKTLSSCFVLEDDPPEFDAITMLDITFYKGARFEIDGVLDHRIHTKPTSQWMPLETSSAHSSHVHTTWPINQ
eukprot:63769-Amphidinium_carterae.1